MANQQPPAAAMVPPSLQAGGELASGGSIRSRRDRRLSGRLQQRASSGGEEALAVDLGAIAAESAPAPTASATSSTPPDSRNPASARGALASLARDRDAERDSPGVRGPSVRFGPDQVVEMGAAPLPSAMVAAGNRGSRGRDGVLKKSVEAATDADAARGWLRDHGFAEPEAEEVEALMGADEIGEFTVKTLNGLGETGVRAVVRGHAGRADGDDVQPRRSRTPNRTGRDAAPPAVCGCSSSPPGSQGGAGRRAKSPASQRRAESPPRDEEAVSNGMFVLLHKNEGRSAPHKRFFRFDGDSQIVTWSKKMPKVMAADDADRAKADGKYAKVISAKADVPVVRANRGKEDDQDFAARCLRLQTLNHGTLALEMPRASDALLWLNIIRDAGVIAEDLSVVTAQETRLQEQSGGPKVDTKSTGPLGRLRSLSNALPAQGKSLSFDGENEDDESDDSDDDADDDGRGGDLIDTTAISEAGIDEDEDLDGQGVLSKEESRLTADEWTLAQDAFDSIAKRNIDILKSPYEQMATRRMQKFQALGPEVEIQLMDNLLRKEYAKNERLIVQGEEGSEFFILLEGSCTIEVDGKYVREVSAPNAFGENALITKAKRTGTIRAKSDIVVVAVLNKATFDHLSARQEYPSFWRRSSLKTKFSAAHQKRLGQTGEITSFSVGTNEVEVKFDDGELLHFPTGALGLEPTVGTAHTTTSGDSDGGGDIPGSSEAKEDKKDDTNIDPVIRACDAPTNSETRTLGIMEDWMLRREELKLEGRRVAVMRDINVAQSYFQRVEEVYHVDQYALTTSTAYFLFAWMLGSVLGFNWGSAVIGLILVINAFVSERSRHSRLYSEVKARVHGRWHRAIERRSREESPEWINHIIAVSWREMGIEKMLSDQIKDIANPMLADISTWYPQVDDISIASLTLGKAAPQINNLHFENSDIFGEFRVNAEAKLDAPDCKATIRVDMTPTPFNLAVADLNVNVDFQLLVRLSSDNGLTLVGVKLRKKLGLDYAISHKLKKNLNSIAGFAVQKVLNDLIHESLWWMSHPCMLLLPWQDPAVTGSPSFVAGSDMEASQFDKPVGQLEIRVKSARHLPVGDWRTNSSDPYVQFLVEKSWPLRQFRTRMVSRNLNPVFEHSAMTTLRWNESQTGIILFEVYDHNEVGSADKLGMAEVPIKMVARKSDSYFKWENRVKLRELSDEKTRGHRAAYLCLSLTYHPAHMSRRVPMLYSGGNEIDNVRGGVLQLEVVSVRNLQHAQDKLYVIIEYGKSFDHSKRSADAWRHGGEKNASRSEAYNPGVFHNDHYRSHEVDPKVFLEKMPENQRREVVQNNYPVVWRDQPIGYKAEHEICVEDCRNAVQISIMTPEIGKDKCLAKFSAQTVPELLEKLHLWEPLAQETSAKWGGGDSMLRRSKSSRTEKRDQKKGHVLNGEKGEEWLPLTEVHVSGIDKFAAGAVGVGKGVGKGVKGVGEGVKKVGKGVAKEAKRVVRSKSSRGLADDDDDHEHSGEDSSDMSEDDAEDQHWLAASGSSAGKPEIRLAVSFYACRMHSRQKHHLADTVRGEGDDWRPPNNGTLSVTLVSASGLIPADDNGFSDPYADVTLGFTEQVGANGGGKVKKSKVKHKTLDPHWGETFLFRIEQYSTDADNMLTIAVRDKDKLGADDFLGSVTIQLTELFRGQWVEHEIDEQFVLEDSEGRCNAEDLARRDKQAQDIRNRGTGMSEEDKNFLDSRGRFPFGRVHLKIEFHVSLDKRNSGRSRGVSMMNMTTLGLNAGREDDDSAFSRSGSLREARDSREASR